MYTKNMDFKKLKVPENKLLDLLLYESNFGWVRDSYDGKDLVLSRNIDRKYAKKLNKIQTEIDKTKKLFPLGSILYLLIGGIFVYFRFQIFPTLDLSFLDYLEDYKDLVITIIQYALLGIGAIFAFVGLVKLIIFIIFAARRKKIIQKKIDLAKEITGLYCKVPLKTCIKEPGPTSNILSKMNL